MVSMLVSGCVSLVASQNKSVPGKLRGKLPKYPEVGDANQLTLWPSQWAIPGVQAPKSDQIPKSVILLLSSLNPMTKPCDPCSAQSRALREAMSPSEGEDRDGADAFNRRALRLKRGTALI